MIDGWRITSISNICKINQSTYSILDKWEFVNYLDTSSIVENNIDSIQHFIIGKDKLPSRARRKVNVDDILYSTVRPNQRHYGIMKDVLTNMLVSTGFAVITTDKLVADSNFIYYYLTQNDIVNLLHSIAEQSVSTYPSIKPSDIGKLKIILPPLEEQQKIGQLLKILDDKIELNNKINKTLEEIAKAIWAEKFGNSNENGLLGDIIELFDYKRVPIPSEKRKLMKNIYPYYGAASLMDYVDNYLFDGIYVLLGEDGTVTDNLGYPMLQYVWGKFWVNNHAHIMRGRNGFTVESLYILLKHTNVRSIVTGAVQPKINQMNLKNLSVFIPKIEDLENFNKLIDPMFSSIRVRSIENIHLFSIRDILLPKLMSGEIRVK